MDINKIRKKVKFNIGIKELVILQFVVIIYTVSSVMAKFASGFEFLSTEFILFYCAEISVLGIYAVLWQQVIKKVDLSVAYANRSIALIWSMAWAVIFFQEAITLKNAIGVLIVVVGTIIVNTDHD
jgi:drug/metabolite transporter (DMT)-like permease